jgi:hypothetical protein
MRNRGLLTELLGHPGRESLWLRALGCLARARAELAVLITLVSVDVLLISYTGLPSRTCGLIEFGGVAVLVAVPPSRRYLNDRVWAVTSRHRIYRCLNETRTMTPTGKLPYLWWSRPSPVGESVQVWLPAGLSVNDLTNTTEALAAACYAAEARVQVNKRHTHLVTITIVRKDPFTGRKIVRPDHLSGVPVSGTDGAWAPLPDRDSIPMPTPPAQHPTVVASMATAGKRTNRTSRRGSAATTSSTASSSRGETDTASDEAPNNKPSTPPPVVGIGGVDVSDYV